MAFCKGCGRPIIWIMSPGGKMIPCDPEKVAYQQKPKARGKIVTEMGQLISCDIEGGEPEFDGPTVVVGYVPHWATCPVAGQFKKERKRG